MSINNRVESLIKKVTVNKASFSSATGISSVILSHISSGRNKVSLKAVEQILKAYPKVNAEWLILGKGAMFKDELDSGLTAELLDSIELIKEELRLTNKSVNGKIDILLAKINAH